MDFVIKHILRAPLKIILTAGMALCFTLVMGWMSRMIAVNLENIEILYNSAEIRAEIRQRDFSWEQSGINHQTVDALINSGYIRDTRLLTSGMPWFDNRDAQEDEADGIVEVIEVPEETFIAPTFDEIPYYIARLLGFENPASGLSGWKWREASIIYADGWDESLFRRVYLPQDMPPVVMSEELMDFLNLELGGSFYHEIINETFIIAGMFVNPAVRGVLLDQEILVPLSFLLSPRGRNWGYDSMDFILNPIYNRELAQVRVILDEIINRARRPQVPLFVEYWDEELRMAIEPMERTLSLLGALFPITLVVSMLAAAGTAILLTLQKAKDAAILRVLGTKLISVRIMLCAEQLIICFFGLTAGILLMFIFFGGVFESFYVDSVFRAILYLLASQVGSIAAGVAVTNQMPLELLQVKE